MIPRFVDGKLFLLFIYVDGFLVLVDVAEMGEISQHFCINLP